MSANQKSKNNRKGSTGKVSRSNRAINTPATVGFGVSKAVEHVSAELDKIADEKVKRLLYSLTMPISQIPLRNASKFDLQPTATCNPFDVTNAGWAKGNALANRDIASTEMVAFLMRNPNCASIWYDHNSSGALYQYRIYGANQTDILVNSPPSAQWDYTFQNYSSVNTDVHYEKYLRTPYAKPYSSYQPHGPVLYAGSAGDQRRFFWIDKQANLSVDYVVEDISGGLGLSWQIALDLWTPNGVVTDAIVNVISGASGTVVLKSTTAGAGYYAVRVVVTGMDVSSINKLTFDNMTIYGSAGVFCHQALPKFDVNAGAAEDFAIHGASIMYTNNASTLNRQGKVVSFQVPKALHWTNFISSTSCFDLVAKSQLSVADELTEGQYGFLRPTSEGDFQPIDCYTIDNGILVDSFWPLKASSDYIVMALACTDYQGQDGYITRAYCCEYGTSDTWRSVDVPDIDEELFGRAIVELRAIRQFHKNNTHINEIVTAAKQRAKSVVDLLQRGLPKALGFIEKYGPYALKAVTMASSLLA